MSLHLNQQCQRANASPYPFDRGTGLPMSEAQTERAKGRVPVAEQPYMQEFSYRQQLFRNFLTKTFETNAAVRITGAAFSRPI